MTAHRQEPQDTSPAWCVALIGVITSCALVAVAALTGHPSWIVPSLIPAGLGGMAAAVVAVVGWWSR